MVMTGLAKRPEHWRRAMERATASFELFDMPSDMTKLGFRHVAFIEQARRLLTPFQGQPVDEGLQAEMAKRAGNKNL